MEIDTLLGPIDEALLEKRYIREPGKAPVLQIIETHYYYQGQFVRSDVEVQVDPACIGAVGLEPAMPAQGD